MQKYICILFLYLNASVFAQSRIVINNDAYIVLSADADIVIDNSNTNAITTMGSGGNIISESEDNCIQWNISSATGNYIIPFTNYADVKIPLAINITTAGTGSGKFVVSTYGGPDWDNDGYKPSSVFNMTNMGVTNNSPEVIDRFWLIDAQGYSVKPSGEIQFNYADAEHLAAGNTITEADLKAERYDEASDNWEVYPVGGVVNTGSDFVAGVLFNATDLTKSWSLIDQTTHLLPVTLTYFESECMGADGILQWQTASEINTDHFELEFSDDGVQYHYLAEISAAGNSDVTINYNYAIKNAQALYIKLYMVDIFGNKEELGALFMDCGNNIPAEVNAFVSGFSQITLQTSGLAEGIYDLQLFDAAGNLIVSNTVNVQQNENSFIIQDERLSAGLYVLKLTDNTNFTYTKKLALTVY